MLVIVKICLWFTLPKYLSEDHRKPISKVYVNSAQWAKQALSVQYCAKKTFLAAQPASSIFNNIEYIQWITKTGSFKFQKHAVL